MDAKRKNDGMLVCIKHVPGDTDEIPIAQYFSAPERRVDPKNHAVPILAHFTAIFAGSEEHFLVMPLLRPFHNPDFFVVSEVVDFIRQTLVVRCAPLPLGFR